MTQKVWLIKNNELRGLEKVYQPKSLILHMDKSTGPTTNIIYMKMYDTFCSTNSFHSSQKAFCKVLGCDCRKSPKERLWLQTWMLNETAWLAISILVHPKGVRWGWGQGTVQASQVLPHPKSSNIVFIWTFNSYTVAHLCWNRKGPSPKCSCRVGSTKIVQDIVVSWSINYPLYWN